MKHKNIKLGMLFSFIAIVNAANIAYVPQTGPGASASAGRQWPATRFTVNGDCITDNLTGLMWAKNASLLGTGSWGDSSTNGTVQYKITQMNTNSSATGYQLCGYNDWRLPNINELASLINYAASKSSDTNNNTPAKWLNNTAGFSNIQDIYWSSTPALGNSKIGLVGFNMGSRSYYNPSSAFYAWPVRGGK